MSSDRTYLLAGLESAAQAPATREVRITRSRRIQPGAARGSQAPAEVSGDAVLRVELENGFVLWSRADDLLRERGRQIGQRDGEATWQIDFAPRPGQPARGSERGWLGLGVRLLEAFGVDLSGKAAGALGRSLEDKQLKDAPPGLYRCALGANAQGDPGLQPACDIGAESSPLLVFIHGTGSSTAGSFGALWRDDNAAGAALRHRFEARYGKRVFALQHRTLTESPIHNALALATALPAGAEVHLVSHSRGGLVGELMCLGMRDPDLDPLSPALIQTLFAADRCMAEQLGLARLDDSAAKARDAAYAADRAALLELLEVLHTKQLRITRFVRVACPARGTTLASGRLDRWLSVLDFIAGNGIFGDALDFLLAVVKERTDPRTLPGLEAMMPGSALTRLLQHPDLVTAADLSVIAGDTEGDSLWSQIKLLAADWFYGSDHDLVVNTGSMMGGLRRVEGHARFLRDEGGQVNHFRYFTNEKTVRWLSNGLLRTDEGDGGFQPIALAPVETPRWREALARSRGGTAPKPLVVILPGTMGSALQQQGETVWLDYWRLLRGQLSRLRVGQPAVEPVDLIGDFYGPLVEFLARSHRVEIFPYDWRMSVREAAARLADALERWLPDLERSGQPVHLVAHSMGGLVVRAMIADGGPGAAIWQRIVALPNSRFMMLGTPNRGSYEAVRWLTGLNATERKLALLDLTKNTDDIIDIVGRYPGLVELLPFAPDDPDFTEPALWKALKAELEATWPVSGAGVLRAARPTWSRLLAGAIDPDHMVYLAGCQEATVTGYRVEPANDWDWPPRRKLVFDATAEGDGTVTWASGRLTGVPTWYVEDTAHDALCTQTRAFPGLLDLLMTGTTDRLPANPPRARAGVPARFVLPEPPFTDDLPDAAAVSRFGFGGGLPATAEGGLPVAPRIRVSVRHGDLAYARYPVVVGHYAGDAIVSAEAALDYRLDHALSRRLRLGMYPAAPGSHALFFNEVPDARPQGAVVVGLGQVGELRPGLLEGGVRTAVLDFALQVAQWPDDHRFGPAAAPRSAALSCLLVGTGAGGMPVSAAVEVILRAAVSAADKLTEQGLENRVVIDEIEFIEIYEDVAISASEGIEQALRDGELSARVEWPDRNIQTGQGRRRRVRCDEQPEWWHRLEIIEEEGRRALRFIFATDRARAEETLMAGQLELADAFIAQASRSPAANSEVAKTLFEMLLPNSLKAMAPNQSNMVLMLDACSARYPWELLENRWGAINRPPAVAAGLVRQLKAREFRHQPLHSTSAKAFVVGNPDLGGWASFPDLPGARREAEEVAAMLRSGAFDVRESVDERADAILAGLHRDAWRILHLAGHGEHEYPLGEGKDGTPRTVSGMVIGRDAFLTPGDVEQMRWVPEVVFINCCHLGKTQTSGSSAYTTLAANLAVQFVNMGVKAVVAAGWAVDDGAASAFAASFYRHLLDGQAFGDAVRAAREVVWANFPGVNTWGAYQCYGDPSYRLRGEGSAPVSRPPQPFFAPAELVTALGNHLEWIRMQIQHDGEDPARLARMRDGIGHLIARVPEDVREGWLARADVAAALGFAWGETGAYAEAIDWLEKAMRLDTGDCPVRAVEQCANFKVRLAGHEWASLRRTDGLDESARDELIERIESAIMELDLICQRAPTSERYALLGSACKRLAWVHEHRTPRREALINMANYYRLAGQLETAGGQPPGAYAFSNQALAEVLVAMMDKAAGLDDAWLADCDAMIERTRARNELNPNVWDALGEADCLLVRLLARPPRGRLLRSEAEQIGAAYRLALMRGASPRERTTVVEHLDFVVALCGDARRTLRDALALIRSAL
ncbi:CHAT domain-containing protein [Nitrogeniibacter mangrovi]|uniref:CHAT domain-containing protein n=1 Tax=Nitrogeniibacter mangrovi TaxID=2016596 RepID=A0A6C1B0M1_9RHOO|nr:CHAT domain-containing protein [Nitrogeniibacter mangrovi]QID16539.1 CHAT domain-containing protein [Nitrogeniibacter mangrovi]